MYGRLMMRHKLFQTSAIHIFPSVNFKEIIPFTEKIGARIRLVGGGSVTGVYSSSNM